MDSILEVQAQCIQDSEEWFPDVAHDLVHHCLAMAGEVGELCNLVKKIERGTLQHTPETQLELAMEVTDVFIYVCNAAAVLNIDLGAAYDHKREFNVGRFGGKAGSTAERVPQPLRSADGEGQ